MQMLLLVGRTTKDAEVLTSTNGKPYCKFSIAVNEYFGEKAEPKTTYYDVVVFGKTAKTAGETIKKADSIFVNGRPEIDAYISKKDNEPRASISVVAKTWRVMK